MQAKRDRVWNTLGWSLIGNIAAIGVVQFLSARPPKRWQQARYVKQKEMLLTASFLTTVGLFTIYGFGCARQTFVKSKLEIIESHSLRSSS